MSNDLGPFRCGNTGKGRGTHSQRTRTYQCLYTNLDGLSNKTAELETIMNEENPDIIFLTETKCNPEMLNATLFNTDCYTIVRKDRPDQAAPGGGVTILIKKTLVVTEDSVSSLVQHEAQESVWCEVRSKEGKDLVLGTVYRTPSSSATNNDHICDLLKISEELTKDKQLLVCGDFNFGNILWEENRVENGSQGYGQALNFLEMINDNFWTQNVTEWTHLRDNDNPSRLDLVFTRTGSEVDNIKYLAPLGLSKHAVICFSLTTDSRPRDHPRLTPRLNYHKADTMKMREMFDQVNWEEAFVDKSVDEKWNVFVDNYNRIVKMCVPTYKNKPGCIRAKWMNCRLEMLIRRKQEAWRKYRGRKNAPHRERYNSARNLVTKEVRAAKCTYEKKVAMDAVRNTRHFWAYVRSKTTAKESTNRLKTHNGDVTEDDEIIAQEMNRAFNSVYVREDANRPSVDPDSVFQGPKLQEILVTREDVQRKLKGLDSTKANGPDGVSPLVLKECSEVLCAPILDIFKSSLDSGSVPDDWRRANISPIHKKGSKMEPLNYRPVSLTSVISKVIESIIREKIVQHLNDNNLITDKQHGFRSKRSCLTNMLCYLDDLVNAVDEGLSVDVNYLDCEKAFDRVPHHRLHIKLKAMGIDGGILVWIMNFLGERYHRVKIRNTTSDWLPVISGVPQGSVLGPVLFLIYINDLVGNLESAASLFADDAKIYKILRTEADVAALRRDMERLDEWSKKWLLSFNVEKCKTMHIGYHNQQADYYLSQRQLQKTTQERDLGITVSASLKSSEHVSKIAAKANSRLGIIKRNFSVLSRDVLLPLYLSLVRPTLDYGAQAWSPYLLQDIRALERVQRRATKLVPELSHRPYEERCKHLGLQTLEDRRIRGDMIETYKLLHGFEDIPYTKFFTLNTNNLRGHSLKLAKPDHCRTNLKGNWFAIRVVNNWNALPESVVTAPTIATFKARYDRHLGISD